jgi:hypothetical protein
MKTHTLTTIVFTTFLASCLMAQPASVYWRGTIDSIQVFSPSSLPDSLQVGSSIMGSLTFEPTAYSVQTIITGSFSGEKYTYSEGLHQFVASNGHEWTTEGGAITLMQYSERLAFDAFTTDTTGTFASFPGYAGTFELGFAIFEESPPFGLFEFHTETPNVTLTSFDYGSGFLTTRFFDSLGDITEGYYITFSIDEVSATPVPEPASFTSILTLISFAYLITKRKRA